MSHRPYPDVDRALHQIERGRLRLTRHTATGLEGTIAYLESDEFRERMRNIGDTIARAFVLVQPRRFGKSAMAAALTKEALAAGQHVHVAGRDGIRCAGGDNDCAMRSGDPLVIARAVQTSSVCPSQWDAWTTGGQYLYLRYRWGIGTVDAYDTPDEGKWTETPTGRVAQFGESSYDGEISLEDFCARAGLELAEDLETR